MTEMLSDEAVAFVADLSRRFRPRRKDLLAARARRCAESVAGGTLGFRSDTEHIRTGDWTALTDRRVEITGPTERKMAVNALNSKPSSPAGRLMRTKPAPS